MQPESRKNLPFFAPPPLCFISPFFVCVCVAPVSSVISFPLNIYRGPIFIGLV